MPRALPWTILIGLMAVLLSISFAAPDLLNDRNSFLRNFVNHEFLATLGFIVAVTLASAASVHFELNRLEDATGKTFKRARGGLRKSAYSLVALFAAAGFIVVLKPLVSEPHKIAVANSLALLILYFNLSVLLDLTRTVFKIPPVSAIKQLDAKALAEDEVPKRSVSDGSAHDP